MKLYVEFKKLMIWMRAILFAALFFSVSAFAQSGPTKLNISGGLYNASGTPVTQASVNFKIEILDKNAACVLYSEEHNSVDLSASKGGFALQIGSGSNISNLIDGTSATALSSVVFKNAGVVAPFTGCAAGVTLAAGDERLIRVHYNLGSGFTAMSPDVPVTSSAYAMVSETLQGKSATDFVQLRDDATYDLNQTNVESIFSAVNFAKLTQILAGNWGNTTLTNVGTPSAGTDAANKSYVDANIGGKIADVTTVGPAAGNGHTLIWDQALNRWVTGTPSATDATKLPLAGGTMTGAIAMGAQNITNIGHMTMAAQRTLNLGTYDNAQEGVLVAGLGVGDKGKIWFNSQDNVFKVWNGTAAVNTATPSGAAGGDLSGTYPNPDIANGVVGSTELTDGGVATADIANDAISAAKINNTGIAVNRLVITDATTGATLTYKTCALDETLKWTASGWACSTAAAFIGNTGVTAATYGNASQVSQLQVDAQGRIVTAANVAIDFPVVSVAGKTGAVTLNAADISGLGTAAAKNFGAAAGNLVELDGGGKIPSGLLPSSSGDIQDVVAGSGLFGGGTSGAVTLAVDTGVTAGKIVQMQASDKLPAVDGSALTMINAVKLQARDIASTAPTAAQVLTWNAGSSAWEPQTLPAGNAGDITSVNAGLGLTGGTTSGDATLAIDVGTVTGKIVQMAASDKLPAVDGSNLTGITAAQISGAFADGGNAVSATANLGTNSNHALNIETNGAPVMSFLANGNTGIATTAPADMLTVSRSAAVNDSTRIAIATSGTLGNQQSALNLVTLDNGAIMGTSAGNKGWQVFGRGNAFSTAAQQNDFGIAYWSGGGWTTPLLIDSATGFTSLGTSNAPSRLTVEGSMALDQLGADPAGFAGYGTLFVRGDGKLYYRDGTGSIKDLSATGTGSVTSVVSGTGLTGGDITTTGTLAVDVGTTTGKIVQMAASDRLPAVSGANLTGITASQVSGAFANGGNSFGSAATIGTNDNFGLNFETNGSTAMTILSTGQVGIYTASPSAKLHIGSAPMSRSYSIDPGSNTAPTYAGLIVTNSSAAIGTGIGDVAYYASDSNGMYFLTGTGSGRSIRMSILPDGKIGFGTKDPVSLHDLSSVNGAVSTHSRNDTAVLANDSIGTIQFWNNDTELTTQNVFGNIEMQAAQAISTDAAAGNMIFRTTGTAAAGAPAERMRIDSAGNMGIGTNNPQSLLHVNGVVRATDICDENGANCKDISGGWGGGGDIDGVYSSTGLLGGFASGSGTLSVDVGTTAGKIVQMAASDKLPAVDGSNLVGITASQSGIL